MLDVLGAADGVATGETPAPGTATDGLPAPPVAGAWAAPVGPQATAPVISTAASGTVAARRRTQEVSATAAAGVTIFAKRLITDARMA
ncbi:hypothetical protein GCM10009738_45540 [Kitasatospora viridis]